MIYPSIVSNVFIKSPFLPLSHVVLGLVFVTSIALVAEFNANNQVPAIAYAVFLIVFFISKLINNI